MPSKLDLTGNIYDELKQYNSIKNSVYLYRG